MERGNYVYWPSGLLRQCELSDEPLVVVVLNTIKADPIVIAVIEESKSVKLDPPYSEFARISHQNGRFLVYSKPWSSKFKTVCFDPPKLSMMQFYSLLPISLVLQNQLRGVTQDTPVVQYQKSTHSQSHNVPKLLSRLSESIDHLNLFYEHLELFYQRYPMFKEKSSLYASVVSIKTRIRTSNFYRMVRRMAFYLAITVRIIAGAISHTLNWKTLPLVQFSVTAQQLDLRCQQLCYVPVQYLRINKKIALPNVEPRMVEKAIDSQERVYMSQKSRRQSHSVLPSKIPCETYPEYIRLYNTLWLLVNDVSFGATFGALLYESREPLSQTLSVFLRYLLYEMPIQLTLRLEQNPLGIKLNDELSRFLSSLFLQIIEFAYSEWIASCISAHNLRRGIVFMSHLSSLVGLTFSLAIAVDFLSVMTLHITLFYMISVKLYHVHIYVLRSLFYLFYGKKDNVLRKRIDNNHFELDQLLMGTLIFTVLIFLLPTLFSFYLVYTAFRFLGLLIKISLQLFLALINHFPLFALLLRVKDPKRLPGGIKITRHANHLKLANNPISFYIMFKPFIDVMKSIQAQLISISTVRVISRGYFLDVERNELYRVLYYNLPRCLIDTDLLWDRLKMVLKDEAEDSRPQAKA